MSDYTPNSHKYRSGQTEPPAEKKRAGKIVTGPVKTKKKNEVRKIGDLIFAEDFETVKNHLVSEVLIPGAKKIFSELIKIGTDILIYGESGRRDSSSGSKVSYRSYYDKSGERKTYSGETRARNRFDYEDIIINSRGEAEEILDQMQELIDTYDVVRVTDLYDMLDITAPYTGNRYGWKSINGAKPIRVDDGYILKLPRVQPID